MVKARGWDTCPSRSHHRAATLFVCSESWSPLGHPSQPRSWKETKWKKSTMRCRTTSRSCSSASCSDNAARLGWSRAACSAAQAGCLRNLPGVRHYGAIEGHFWQPHYLGVYSPALSGDLRCPPGMGGVYSDGAVHGQYTQMFPTLIVAPLSIDLTSKKLHQQRRVHLRLQHVGLPFERAVPRVR